MASVFFSYPHADEAMRDQLEKQLAMLRRQKVIETWHDRRIGAGQNLDHEIDDHIERDEIILLLVSADFLASDYCYDREMLRAMERHSRGAAIVIPVILRACDWHGAPFGKLMATPPDGKPITQWPDQDQAMLEVAKAVRGAAERLAADRASPAHQPSPPHAAATSSTSCATEGAIRTSNLRVAKTFSERDRDVFRRGAFDYMATFFENSLSELGARNPEIESGFTRLDANRFTATVYREGRALSRCTVFMGGGHFGSGIAYISTETTESNSFNENLSAEADDQMLFLRSMGMARMGQNGRDEKLSFEGAAELYWSIFVEPLQRG
ncbi:MAG TPA: toll/interleukin-1 receptor domain-containing protein [Phenylobacterium sp.]|nr:toll/interleukin-1 receptor domain-containing protein [Phenylobacterium sp.]